MDGPVAVAGVNGNGLSNSLHSAIDPQLVVDYLSNILRATLGATENDLKATGSLFGSEKISETLQRCSRFAQDAQAASICVEKEAIEGVVNGDTTGDTGNNLQHLSLRLY